jgi:hypothetical protein
MWFGGIDVGIGEFRLELREELRLENRQAFASIWSDFAAALAILALLVFNPRQVWIRTTYILYNTAILFFATWSYRDFHWRRRLSIGQALKRIKHWMRSASCYNAVDEWTVIHKHFRYWNISWVRDRPYGKCHPVKASLCFQFQNLWDLVSTLKVCSWRLIGVNIADTIQM